MLPIVARERVNFNISSAKPRGFCTAKLIANKADVIAACAAVYNSGIIWRQGTSRENVNSPSVRPIINHLGNKIYSYFNNYKNKKVTQSKFDLTLDTWCCYFRDALSAVHAKSERNLQAVTYGNAQKLINMTIKYLSCFEDYDDYAHLFERAHIPIDSIILRRLKDIYNIDNIDYTLDNTDAFKVVSAHYRGISWSNFSQNDYKNLLNEYRNAESVLNRLQGHSFLGAEFFWWSGRDLPVL